MLIKKGKIQVSLVQTKTTQFDIPTMRVLAVACALMACAPSTFLVAEATGLRKNSHVRTHKFCSSKQY